MSKGERACFIAQEYGGWCKTLKTKYPDASVNRFMAFTTGKCTTSIDGAYLYRNFQEGLRIFHNEWNSLWAEILAGQISGKSPEEIWSYFLYRVRCKKKGTDPEGILPETFTPVDQLSMEKQKWSLSYKCLGPPRELFNNGECHEFLNNPQELAARGSGAAKRKGEVTSRTSVREKKARGTKSVVTTAHTMRKSSVEKKAEVDALELGRRTTCQNLMRIAAKVKDSKFDRLFRIHQILTDPAKKQELQQDMYNLVKDVDMTYKDASKSMAVIDLTDDSPDGAESSEVSDDGDQSSEGGDGDSEFGDVADVEKDDLQQCDAHRVIADIFHRSGYVIIPEVM